LIAEFISNSPLGVSAAAERCVLEYLHAEEVRSPRVFVAPGGIAQVFHTRGDWTYQYEIDIVVCQAIQRFNLAEEDQLVTIVERLGPLIAKGRYNDGLVIAIDGESTHALFDEAAHEGQNFFLGMFPIRVDQEVPKNAT
jgi:hypothetical protein